MLSGSLVVIVKLALAKYALQDDYFQLDSQGSFFDKFAFWSQKDPTDGFVRYKGYEACLERDLIRNTSSNIIMRADSTNVAPYGRPSVRIESKKTYNKGLIVLDLDHMPGSICGLWPAFWTYGPSWPKNGEIDIIEGINEFRANRMSLHTGPGCSLSNKTHGSLTMRPNYSGEVLYTPCVSGENGTDNTGCSIGTRDTSTYGNGLNARGGGIYVADWSDDYIAIYFFPRESCRGDEVSGPLGDHPDPASWGLPLSKFYLTCDIGRHFRNHSIIFDITFCGGWADGKQWNTSIPINSTWPPDPTFDGVHGAGGNQSCARRTGHSCKDWVMNHPEAFKDAYWSVNALRVYQEQEVEDQTTYGPTSPIEPAVTGLYESNLSESEAADTTSVDEEQLDDEQSYENRSRLVHSRHLTLDPLTPAVHGATPKRKHTEHNKKHKS